MVKLSKLSAGQKFRFVGLEREGAYELLRSSFTGCLVRPVTKRERAFETRTGQIVKFEAPSSCELVGGGSLVEVIS